MSWFDNLLPKWDRALMPYVMFKLRKYDQWRKNRDVAFALSASLDITYVNIIWDIQSLVFSCLFLYGDSCWIFSKQCSKYFRLAAVLKTLLKNSLGVWRLCKWSCYLFAVKEIEFERNEICPSIHKSRLELGKQKKINKMKIL